MSTVLITTVLALFYILYIKNISFPLFNRVLHKVVYTEINQ